MKKVIDKIISIIPIFQYIDGFKNLTKIKKILEKFKNVEKYGENKNNYIPLPNLKDYEKTIKKFMFSESKNSEVVNEFLDSEIEIKMEKFNFKEVDKDDVILVCVVKNDLSRVKQLVEYYRNIGIKHFTFIDNNSDDGTYEFLINQPDTNVYSTKQQYTTQRREGWMNRIYSYIGFNKWILSVDSDELFTYIGVEQYSINEYISKIKIKQKRVRTVLLDMYSNKNIFDENIKDDSITNYCYFDTDTYWNVSSFRSKLIQGGPRNRIFSKENEPFICTASKYPLFYYERGDFQGSSHWSFPYNKNKSEIGAVLRHYKFMNSDMEKYKQRILNGNYAAGSLEYKKYFEVLNNNENISFYNKNSVKYENSASLRKINVSNNYVKDYFIK